MAIKEQQKSKGSNQTNLAYDMYSFVEPSGGGAKSEKARKTSFDVAQEDDVAVKAKGSKIIGFSKPDWVAKITNAPTNNQIERDQ